MNPELIKALRDIYKITSDTDIQYLSQETLKSYIAEIKVITEQALKSVQADKKKI